MELGSEPLIVDMEHVHVARGGQVVLHDVSLKIAQGEHVVLLGPNGCGKSTLLKVMTCELYPLASPPSNDRSAGTPTLPKPETHVRSRIRLWGRERWDVTELRRKMGVVSADSLSKPMLATNGFDAVLTGFFSSSMLWPHLEVTAVMRARASDILALVGAEGLRNKKVALMSAGEQRRIMIGRAMAGTTGEVQVLLLDEPSNGLDLAAQYDLRAMLRSLAQAGTAILLVTHHVGDILPEIDRVLMMREGRVVADGSKGEMLKSARMGELFGRRVVIEEFEAFYYAR